MLRSSLAWFYEETFRWGPLDRLAAERPERDIGASEPLAAVVTGAVFGELHIRALLGENSAMTEAEMSRRIDIALGPVFAGLRPGGDDQTL